MTGLGTFLADLMKTLTARVMTALGFSVVSVTGVTEAIDTLQNLLINNLQDAPAMGLQLAVMAGADVSFGLVLGAVAFRFAMWQVANTMRILGIAGS